jgi:hypothetical protein
MIKKTFSFKIEELLTIVEFILNSVRKDMNDFSSFSSIFTPDYIDSIESRNTACGQLLSSSLISKELKAVTQQIKDTSIALRTKLNILEGYLDISADSLDISSKDMGLKAVRRTISKGNIEGLIASMREMLAAIRRNLPVLEAGGLNPLLLDELESEIKKIDALNVKQNDMISNRNRQTERNILEFNALWDSLQPILKTARAMYRSKDSAKLKDYTISQLLKRINSEKRKKQTTTDHAED